MAHLKKIVCLPLVWKCPPLESKAWSTLRKTQGQLWASRGYSCGTAKRIIFLGVMYSVQLQQKEKRKYSFRINRRSLSRHYYLQKNLLSFPFSWENPGNNQIFEFMVMIGNRWENWYLLKLINYCKGNVVMSFTKIYNNCCSAN